MTSRAWKTLVVGLVGVLVVAAVGAFAARQGRSSSPPRRSADWGLYTATRWNAVTASFSRRGFLSDSVRVVTGTRLANGQPFALIGAHTQSGRTCFAAARGTQVGPTTCRLSKPLVAFSAPDTCAPCAPAGPPLKTHTIVGLVRRDVTATIISQRHESGLGVVPAGRDFAFNASFVRPGDRLRARDAAGHPLASITY
jgi:hypothetical protein